MTFKPLAVGLSPSEFMFKFCYPNHEEMNDLFLFQAGPKADRESSRFGNLLSFDYYSGIPHSRRISVMFGKVIPEKTFKDIAWSIEAHKYPRVFFPSKIAEDGSVVFYDAGEETQEELGRRITAEIYKLCLP